jgi:tetratricopeptide (TPR) repeat protein
MREELTMTYDPETLREVYADPAAVQRRIAQLKTAIGTAPDDIIEYMHRAELVDLVRCSGDLDEALTQATLAVDRAELGGKPAQQHMARLRLAHVHQWRGEFVEADLLFIELLGSGPGFGPAICAITHHHAGKNDYDQGRYADAVSQFDQALYLRRRHEFPNEEIAASKQALKAAQARLKGPDDEHDDEQGMSTA